MKQEIARYEELPPVSNPFRAGRDSSVRAFLRNEVAIFMFQTPSERGGIPLSCQSHSLACSCEVSFKPLQSGAGFLWGKHRDCCDGTTGSFKPLQSGAGFLCRWLFPGPRWELGVSNPFRAGRDSSVGGRQGPQAADGMFQTPSERGGIPLDSVHAVRSRARRCFKPLQSGAGFLWRLEHRKGCKCGCFKPLQSGAGFLCSTCKGSGNCKPCVSNPFRAGRDSSAGDEHFDPQGWAKFQTPSERGGIPLRQTMRYLRTNRTARFKPLQSGAGFL